MLSNTRSNQKVYFLTSMAMLSAIILLLGLTPLGFLMLPGIAITFTHIPVIIGSYFFGVKGGAILGTVFGFASLIRCFISPDAAAVVILGTNTGGFTFYNLFLIVAIIFLPRILTGVFSALVFKGMNKICKKDYISMGVSAFVGSMTNTLLFLGGLYVFVGEQYAVANGMTGDNLLMVLLSAILTVVAINGVIEAITAVVLSTSIGKALNKFLFKKRISN